jgi:NADP-dependent alcohol dehydrogenase
MEWTLKLSDYTKRIQQYSRFYVKRFDERVDGKTWRKQNITLEKVKSIVEMSY